MIKVTYISYEGERSTVEVEEGLSLMEAARNNGVPGIDGDCGGVCACASCKVLVEAPFDQKVGPPASEDEVAMLEFRSDVPANARLACMLFAAPELDGITLRTPKTQDAAIFNEEC